MTIEAAAGTGRAGQERVMTTEEVISEVTRLLNTVVAPLATDRDRFEITIFADRTQGWRLTSYSAHETEWHLLEPRGQR